jgi:hypothetical protein
VPIVFIMEPMNHFNEIDVGMIIVLISLDVRVEENVRNLVKRVVKRTKNLHYSEIVDLFYNHYPIRITHQYNNLFEKNLVPQY